MGSVVRGMEGVKLNFDIVLVCCTEASTVVLFVSIDLTVLLKYGQIAFCHEHLF